jgi:hypothetical protein
MKNKKDKAVSKPIKKKFRFKITLKGRAKVIITKYNGKRYAEIRFNIEKLEKSVTKQLIADILEASNIKKENASMGGWTYIKFPSNISNDSNALLLNRTKPK